ncbi:MAG: protein kinase [Deltaproteobacteria bacterium]|nr:protein kinase [Deltaproteobacteria bacterium]
MAKDSSRALETATGDRGGLANRDPADSLGLIGTVLGGYQILELLGKGTAARVYRAVALRTGRECALKVHHGGLGNPTLLERMRREAEILMSLDHPNLVAVFDIQTTEEGRPLVAMELLRGRTLRQLLDLEGVLSPRRAAAIARQIACGLEIAHRAGIVHRDLKPANLMVVEASGREVVKILDFGIARALDGELTQLTATQQLLGTPAYMAPEQVRRAAGVGPEADLYSLGAILFAMLDGQPPFTGTVLQVIEAKLQSKAPPLRPSCGLEQLVARLLERDPERRPRSGTEVRRSLDASFQALDTQESSELVAPTFVPPGAEVTDSFDEVSTSRTLPGEDELREPIAVETPRASLQSSRRDPSPLVIPTRSPSEATVTLPRWALGLILGSAVFAVLATVAAALFFVAWRTELAARGPTDPPPGPEVVPRIDSRAHGDSAESAPAASQVIAREPSPLAEGPVTQEPSDRSPEPNPRHVAPAARALSTPRRDPSANAEAELQRTLEQRGLLMADLELADPSGLVARWRDTRSSRSPDPVLLESLAAAARRFVIDPPILLRKLNRLRAELQERAPTLETSVQQNLEGRYFELRKRVRPGIGSTEAEEIARAIEAVRREVGGESEQ